MLLEMREMQYLSVRSLLVLGVFSASVWVKINPKAPDTGARVGMRHHFLDLTAW